MKTLSTPKNASPDAVKDENKTFQVDNIEAGLTDDERVSREEKSNQDGARVTPGPADLERQKKHS